MASVRMALVLCVVLGACDRGRGRDDVAAADTMQVVENGARAAELLAPIRAVSLAAVEYGDMGTQRAVRDDIREYARVVATDHRALVGVLDSAARSYGSTLQETAAARDLGNSVRMAHSGLGNLSGGDFDLAFIRAEVESHRQLLDRLDNELVPEAEGLMVQPVLHEIRAMADAHLARARQLLAMVLGEPVPPAAPPGAGTPGITAPPAPRPRPDTVRPPPDTMSRMSCAGACALPPAPVT